MSQFLMGLLLLATVQVGTVHSQAITEYIPDQDAWLLKSEDQGSKLKFYY